MPSNEDDGPSGGTELQQLAGFCWKEISFVTEEVVAGNLQNCVKGGLVS